MIRERLDQCMSRKPLDKPTDHKGGPETDVLKLELTGECVQSIVDALENARAELKLKAGSSQSNLGTLIKSWEEYAQWLTEPPA